MNSSEIKRISVFGPQGSGKGTQSQRLCEFFGIPHIAPGNIFRKAIADKSKLGAQVESIINAGHLVPDQITNELMNGRLQEEDCVNGFVLDGYPRNPVQADALDAMTGLSHALLIDIPDNETIRRLSQRRVCPHCGATYHLESQPPKTENACDSCGHALIHRDDDKPEAISQRLSIYHTMTEPLLQRYEQRGVLRRVDGVGSIDDVWKRVLACVQ